MAVPQEFLRGKEYVLDHVSVDGVHKTMMSWVDDKRPVNGAALVYHGALPVPSDSLEAMETESGPCLVEIHCRAHDADGIGMPRVRALTGGFPRWLSQSMRSSMWRASRSFQISHLRRIRQ